MSINVKVNLDGEIAMNKYPNDWTELDIENCSYCVNCGEPIKNGNEKYYDFSNSLCCSHRCVSDSNEDHI